MKVSEVFEIVEDCDRLRDILLQDEHELILPSSEIQKICSDDNPHECRFLIEACLITFSKPKQKSSHSDDCFCSTCKHFEDSDILKSPCPICIGFSNWEEK